MLGRCVSPEPPKGDLFYTRRFLNGPAFDTTAAIYARLNAGGYADLKLSDCHKELSFDLRSYDSGNENHIDFENTLFKLELMERTVRGLRLALLKHAKKNGYTHREEV